MESHKKAFIIIGSLAVLVVVLVAVFFWSGKKGQDSGEKKQPEPEVSKLLSAQSAADIALAAAKTWKVDAELAQSQSVKGETDKFGHSDDWEFLFVSASTKNKGYRVVMADRTITKQEEVPYTGKGEELPDNLISSEEAIARMRQIKGYENLQVQSVELVVGDDGQWYWGIKTDRGTVSIKAEKK